MNIIKVYCSNKDIRIKGIINHFMKYLGIYVIEIYDGKDNGMDSMCDIHIISKNYSSSSTFVNDNKKNVFVLTNGLDIDLRDIRKVYYSDLDMRTFLHDLIDAMQDVFKYQRLLEKRLVYADTDYIQIISKIIDIYCKYKIFEGSVYIHEYPANEDLFTWTISNFYEYLKEMYIFQAKLKVDLIKQAILQAQVEADIMCRKNSYELLFPTNIMLKECDELLQKYASNEEIKLIKAGIYDKLLSFSAKAANEYGSTYLEHCHTAWLERSRVYTKIGDIQSAEISVVNALNLDRLNYKAWYQYAICLIPEEKSTDKCIDTLTNVFVILENKWNENILSPNELKYLDETMRLLKEINGIEDTEYERIKEELNTKRTTSKYTEIMKLPL